MTTPRIVAGGFARALAFLLLIFLVQGVLVTVFATPIHWLDRAVGDQLLVDSLLLVVAVVVATAIMLRSIDVRPLTDIGVSRAAARPTTILQGWCLGGLTIAAACGVLLALGALRVEPSTPGSSLMVALRATVMLVPAALGEELAARGYLLTTVRDGVGAPAAVVITSLLFAVAHLRNPGVTAESLFNVALAGVFLAAIRVVLDSLYAAWAAHVAWNWVMAVPFHASVSGLDFGAPDYRTVSHGPAWLTGGQWGPEGGIAAALGMLAGLAYLYRTRPRREES